MPTPPYYETDGSRSLFHESDIPQILADAWYQSDLFMKTGYPIGDYFITIPGTVYDVSEWPQPLKNVVINAAKRCWEPGCESDCSTWPQHFKQEAIDLFETCPPLMMVFEYPPAAVAEAWQAHQSQTGHGQFLLEIPLSSAEEVRKRLAQAGIAFDPYQNITATVDRIGRYVNHTGRNLKDVADSVNRWRRENHLQDDLRTDPTGMSLAERRAILTFAAVQCDWDSETPPNVTYAEPDGWAELAREHPRLIMARGRHKTAAEPGEQESDDDQRTATAGPER